MTELVVYQNNDIAEFAPTIVKQLQNGTLEWVGLSSPSIARQFAELLNAHKISPADLQTQLAAISPVTAEAAREIGLKIAVEATTHTWDGIVESICEAVVGKA